VFTEEELTDVFDFFDDDSSGCISVPELSACIQALGENKSAKEADELAAHVDSDGSGTIDHDEFFVFMRPLMSISAKHDYTVRTVQPPDKRMSESWDGEDRDVELSVGLLGVRLQNGNSLVSYSFFSLVRIDEQPTKVTLTVLQQGVERQVSFATKEAGGIVANVSQQQSRLNLIRDIQVDKQQREVRKVFDLFDEDHSGEIGKTELLVLLETLGQTLTDEEVNARIRHFDTDNSGEISFDEFVLWMTEVRTHATIILDHQAPACLGHILTDCL